MGGGCRHKKISDYYQTLYPNIRGYSERSIRRFCRASNITICDVEIDNYVENFIPLYSHRYCRSMIQGSIRYTLGISSGIVSQKRIARSLKISAPLAYEARARDTLDRAYAIPSFAPYFGYKGHMDQNEKNSQEYGYTHVALIDDCSQMMCGYASMEVKNPILIYEYVFCPPILKYWLYGISQKLTRDKSFHYAYSSKIFSRIIVKVLKKSLGSKQPLDRMLLSVFGLN